MRTYLVTGGAGFIGSNYIQYMFHHKYNNDNKYYNELDLKFTAKVIKSSLSVMQTKISVNHLIDPLAKLVFSLAVKNVNEKGIFILSNGCYHRFLIMHW